jgi:hypothetical protein
LIGKIRRILAQPVQEEKDWNLEDSLEDEADQDPDSYHEEERGPAAVEGLKVAPPGTIIGGTSYYTTFVQSCINSGGKFADQAISVRWLRMILAGLQGVELSPNDMWRTDAPGSEGAGTPTDESLYWELFQDKLTI